MVPDENRLGAYVRYLRDKGYMNAVGAVQETDTGKVFGVRVGGFFYSVAELRDARNRAAVMARNFAQVRENRAINLSRPAHEGNHRERKAV
jgi:hypothetical protein